MGVLLSIRPLNLHMIECLSQASLPFNPLSGKTHSQWFKRILRKCPSSSLFRALSSAAAGTEPEKRFQIAAPREDTALRLAADLSDKLTGL